MFVWIATLYVAFVRCGCLSCVPHTNISATAVADIAHTHTHTADAEVFPNLSYNINVEHTNTRTGMINTNKFKAQAPVFVCTNGRLDKTIHLTFCVCYNMHFGSSLRMAWFDVCLFDKGCCCCCCERTPYAHRCSRRCNIRHSVSGTSEMKQQQQQTDRMAWHQPSNISKTKTVKRERAVDTNKLQLYAVRPRLSVCARASSSISLHVNFLCSYTSIGTRLKKNPGTKSSSTQLFELFVCGFLMFKEWRYFSSSFIHFGSFSFD